MPENSRQREAFDSYWELGADRSIELLHSALSRVSPGLRRPPGVRTLYEWARRYRWQERIQSMERQARGLAEEARVAALHEMYERQAREALLLQQRGTEWLSTFEADDATPDSAIRAIVEGAKLERLSRGEPTERNAKGTSDDERFARFTDDEIELLAAEAERLVGGAHEEEA